MSETPRTGIDLSELSGGTRPQDDLFRHVNGSWLATTQIPADRAVHGTFHALHEEAEKQIRTIIEECAAGDPPPGSEARMVGDLFASFMDEERIEALGLDPVRAELDLVTAITDVDELQGALGALGRSGVPGVFGAWVNTDAKQSDRYVLYLSQGGLSLPDESYYREEQFAPVREAYLAHVAAMFTLAGHGEAAADHARTVLALETRLASHHRDRVASRDATAAYNLHRFDELQALAPQIGWSRWAGALGAGPEAVAEVVVRQPEYFTALGQALVEVPLADWRTWLTWRVLHDAAPFLPGAFVAENFAFYGTTLSGAPEIRARWKRGVSVVESALGEAVGRIYVERHFPPEAKARMQQLVANLVRAYRQSIERLEWMGEDTRRRALTKLEKFTPKIGYPDRWRDYTGLEVRADDLVGNARRLAAYELDRELAKLGGPVDRDEWFMTPQTVNAYYNPGMNEIVFPAAILQPPFFDAGADDAVNYGAIGAVIGHEIGHGFDDQGSKYDGDGNLNDWWTDADRAEFEVRTKALIAQYDVLEPEETPGHRVNGALTVGENIGDLGGLKIAHTAYQLAQLDEGAAPVLDGLTADQRFFIGWALAWRTKTRPEEQVRRLATDPHSPAEFRCNTVVSNIDAFHEAFGTAPGDGLWLEPEARVRIW